MSNFTRISNSEALDLIQNASLLDLAQMASERKLQLHPKKVTTFVVDRNINYTNICWVDCKFCAFYRHQKDEDAYVLSYEEIDQKIDELLEIGGTQILFQGGVHPKLKIDFYEELVDHIHKKYPQITIHGFSAIEIDYISKISKISYQEVLQRLKDKGLASIPGAGAEILNDDVRDIIAPKKLDTKDWLEVHRQAHKIGVKSTATMMFGTVESDEQIIDHWEKIRDLQDETAGFRAFIMWSFQSAHTKLAEELPNIPPQSSNRYLRLLAVARLYLDNFPNIQSSWVTQGSYIGQMALKFGANDLGSTMMEENVVSAAGSYKLDEPARDDKTYQRLWGKPSKTGYSIYYTTKVLKMIQLKVIFLLLFFLQGILMSATLEKIHFENKKIATIFEKYNALPIFNLQLIFTNGGYINDGKHAGITSLSAQLLNEGTQKDGSVNFARKLENNAISIHTSNGFETFVIEVTCLKSEMDLALNLLNELLSDPNLSEKTLEKLKTLALSRIEQKENDFDYIASKELKELTFKSTPLELPSIGTKESIKDITLNDIEAQLKTILNLDNLIIAVGGDIELENISKNIQPILKNFQALGKTQVQKFSMSDKVQYKEIEKETEQSYIYFMSPFDIDVNSMEAYKAKVASFILGGSGFGSRMMEEIRVKHGLAYSAYGNIKNQKSHSYFSGYLQTKLDNTQKAKEMVEKIVKQFVKKGVTQKELEAAKKFLSGSEPLRTETFSQRLNRSFHLYYKGLDQDYPEKELELIEKLTLKDLNKFIKSHKEIENLTFSIVTKTEKE